MEEVAISFNVLFIICITSYKYTSTFPYNNKGSGNVIGSSSPTHVFNFNAVGRPPGYAAGYNSIFSTA